MKILFKQRLFSWFDSYDIYDENGDTLFTVRGILSWGHCLKIYDTSNNHIGTVKEEVFTFLPRFMMYVGNDLVGEINKEFTFFYPKFNLNCNGWVVNGNFMEWNYEVFDGNRIVMKASKKWLNFSDTYEIEIFQEDDVLYSLMIVLAIDAAKCSDNNS